MELEVGEGLTGEEVVVEAAHRRRHHRHPLEETLPLHRRTHLVQGDHQNASHSWSSKRSSRSKYKFNPSWTGALGNPVAMSYIGNNNRTLDNLFSFVSVFLVQQWTELERGIALEQSGPWSSCVAVGVFKAWRICNTTLSCQKDCNCMKTCFHLGKPS